MDTSDIVDLLSIVQAGDNRTVGPLDVTLWHQILGHCAKDDCLEAILAHRREQPGVWLEPGHIVARVKAMVHDRYERMEPDARHLFRDRGSGARHDVYGYIDKTASDLKSLEEEQSQRSGETPKREVTRNQPPWKKIKCPHCKAPPGEGCHVPFTNPKQYLKRSAAHPSRLEAVNMRPDFAAVGRARKAWDAKEA